jgi:hypothetical protein
VLLPVWCLSRRGGGVSGQRRSAAGAGLAAGRAQPELTRYARAGGARWCPGHYWHDRGGPLMGMSKAEEEQQARLERARAIGLFRYMLIREAADPALSSRQRGAMVPASTPARPGSRCG